METAFIDQFYSVDNNLMSSFNFLLYLIIICMSAYMENLLILFSSKNPELVDLALTERSRLEDVVKRSFTQLIELGYSEFTIEAFYEVSQYKLSLKLFLLSINILTDITMKQFQ